MDTMVCPFRGPFVFVLARGGALLLRRPGGAADGQCRHVPGTVAAEGRAHWGGGTPQLGSVGGGVVGGGWDNTVWVRQVRVLTCRDFATS